MCWRGRFLWLGTTLAALPCCEIVGGFEELEPARPGATTPHRCDALPAEKVDPRGVELVLIKASNERCFWAERTEVTVAEYAEFASDNPTFSDFDPNRCSWKTSLSRPHVDPSDTCASATGADLEPFGAQRPIRCVDWCDARAFCTWAGKDLCFDGFGYSNVEPQPSTPDWGSACAPNTPYPYGKVPKKGACNVGMSDGDCMIKLNTPCRVADVASFAECTYSGGPFDMLGNVAEWVLLCNIAAQPGPEVPCHRRGGAFSDDLSAVSCASLVANPPLRMDSRRLDLGFRCCDELTGPEQQSLE